MNEFVNLPLPDRIAIIVVLSVVSLWLIALIISIIFSLIFHRKIRNNSNAINLLLTQRYEIMVSFIKIAESYRVKIPEEERKSIAYLERISNFQQLSKNDRDQRVLSFIHASHNIISLCEHSSKLVKSDEYTNNLIEFNDVEESYRQKSASYNADVIGYNYWISIPTIKFIFHLFGVRKKDLII